MYLRSSVDTQSHRTYHHANNKPLGKTASNFVSFRHDAVVMQTLDVWRLTSIIFTKS
jgi:hypothetical protein